MARRRVWALRQQFERRWKEMWDDATGRPFYHDKNTGEIRWRRPQHLLNQLPKPMCTNCEDNYAAFECKDCVEFFCMTCWPQVHFGGRRKHHLHRCRLLCECVNMRVWRSGRMCVSVAVCRCVLACLSQSCDMSHADGCAGP